MASAAVYHVLMMRVVFFPKRCKPCYHIILSIIAEHADNWLNSRYGPAYEKTREFLLEHHWNDIIKDAGRYRRHIQNIYPSARAPARKAQP